MRKWIRVLPLAGLGLAWLLISFWVLYSTGLAYTVLELVRNPPHTSLRARAGDLVEDGTLVGLHQAEVHETIGEEGFVSTWDIYELDRRYRTVEYKPFSELVLRATRNGEPDFVETYGIGVINMDDADLIVIYDDSEVALLAAIVLE